MTDGTTRAAATDPVADDPQFGTMLLPHVVHEATAALLIVDIDQRLVTYANDLAAQLVPDRRLPMPVDEWSVAAGLEDVDGGDLPEGRNQVHGGAESLLRVAAGEPIMGEPVTAARATRVTAEREMLWVVGLPLTDAPEPISSLALVAFLPARKAQLIAGAQESAVGLRERAVLATKVAFTISDPRQPDNPLVWVNPAFSSVTGYSVEEALGRNCRFLQGPETDRAVIDNMRSAIAEGLSITTTLLNYRHDGSTFWNELSISPVSDARGDVTHFVGVQADVTARVTAQRSRDDALAQVALVADRLGLLADVTSRMAAAQRPGQIVEVLGQVLTSRVGSACAIYTFDDAGRLERPYLRHERQDSDQRVGELVQELATQLPDALPTNGPVWRVLRGESRGLVIADTGTAPDHVSGISDVEHLDIDRELGLCSMLAVPLRARHSVLGAVCVMNDDARPAFGDAELALVQDLAVRAGLMLENTQLWARERATAATLQRSLLPRLPQIGGLEVAASYVPAADEAAVGGDWYDVFELRGHTGVGVVVGDVMGHNYDSAARMGKLSTIVRSYGWPGSEPWTVLTAVDELLEGGNLDYMATCFYGTLMLRSNGATLHYSSAGHPPALLRRPGGSVVLLEDGRGPMIGISKLMPPGTQRPKDASIDLAPGSVLICFTDGLTDGFADEPDLDAGLAELSRLTSELPLDASPSQIVDQLTAAAERHDDDVAVVAIRIR
ncbi:SpoIIE family protein phosphatase [uncultured Jatrophihabitans sp.]|uniref:SpoIIE family protein phosphatase n=1 Tax=uncultured Jatrophihabitans sp. TaxID=1610747 RepID=UPI0035CB8034